MTTDRTIVVGAGLAGLTAARQLAAAGRDVLVLEARDRVGGRTWTRDVHGARLDVGAQWLDATQTRMLALCDEFGLARFPTHVDGDTVLLHRGRRSTYTGTIPRLSPLTLVQVQAFLSSAEKRLAGRIDPAAPHEAPDAADLDGTPLAAWLRRNAPGSSAREVIDVAITTIFGAEADELSTLWTGAYAAAGGGMLRLAATEGGAQELRFVDGAQSVALHLAEELGDAVVTGAPVAGVAWGKAGVAVHDRTGRTWDGRDVVVAVPPNLAAKVDWDPVLPHERQQVHQRWAMGATTKVIAVYDRPFWREAGLSGEAVATASDLTATFDNTSHDGSVPSLVSFVVGDRGRAWSRRPASVRQRLVLDHLIRAFGPYAGEPVDLIEQDWTTEPFTGGCPVANPAVGALARFPEAIRSPVGPIHWAGTETATEWTGYMEGAVQSGERAAAEVLAGR